MAGRVPHVYSPCTSMLFRERTQHPQCFPEQFLRGLYSLGEERGRMQEERRTRRGAREGREVCLTPGGRGWGNRPGIGDHRDISEEAIIPREKEGSRSVPGKPCPGPARLSGVHPASNHGQGACKLGLWKPPLWLIQGQRAGWEVRRGRRPLDHELTGHTSPQLSRNQLRVPLKALPLGTFLVEAATW